MITHKCPIEGCEARCRYSILMCAKHWRMVPLTMQREVYKQWRREPFSEDYLNARAAAIDAVHSALSIRPIGPTRQT